ncbi:MAG: sigma-70 family RNA polymerase sigma factor [Alphaproteobacteria bacterium]
MSSNDRPGAPPASSPKLDWSDLLRRAQDGDRDAYQAFLLDITPYLRRIARRYHDEQTDIEDAVQDILLSIHVARHTYDPSRPISPWLRGIARHRIIDRLRRWGRTTKNETPLTVEHETFDDPAPNLQENALLARDLKSAIAQLPAGQRQAVELLKLQGLSLQEASDASGMSVGALKVATHRAMHTLRKLLSR